MTPYELHVEKWSNCQECQYHETRKKVVFFRGEIPCDVLFIGEGPGRSEDIHGIPFVGPAGFLLDSIIEESFPGGCFALTNLVACLPTNELGEKAVEPDKGCVAACSPRLREFIDLAQPKVIVCVGSLSTRYITKMKLEIPLIHIVHPAYIIRSKTAQQGLLRRKCVIAVVDGLAQYLKR